MTLLEFAEAVYIPSRLNLSRGAAEQLVIACRRLQTWHGAPVRTESLSPELVVRWMRSMTDSGLSAATINGKRQAVLTLWRAAARRKLAPPLPEVEDVPKLRGLKRLPQAWSISEVERLVATCRSLKGRCRANGIPRSVLWPSLVLMLYETGARLGAVLSILSVDVCLADRFVRLRAETSKTGLEQIHYLSDSTIAAVAGHYDPSRERLFPWGASHRSIWDSFRAILSQAQLPTDRRSMFHRLRRTTATLLACHGSIEMARAAMGHTSERMTRAAYIDPRQMSARRVCDVLPRVR